MALALAQRLARPGAQRKTKLTGLMRLGERPPDFPVGEGLAQRCLERVPAECPKCGRATIEQPQCRECGEPTLGWTICRACGLGEHYDRRVFCTTCCWDSYLVVIPKGGE